MLITRVPDYIQDLPRCGSDSAVSRPSSRVIICLKTYLPRSGSEAQCTLDSIFDFGAMYIVCLFISYASPLILLKFLTFSFLMSSLTYLFQ